MMTESFRALTKADIPVVLKKLDGLPEVVAQTTLQQIIGFLCAFPRSVEVHACATQALIRIASAGRTSSSGCVSRADIMYSGVLAPVMLGRHMFPDNEETTLLTMTLLAIVCLDESIKLVVARFGVVEVVLVVLARFPGNRAIIIQCLNCLQRLGAVLELAHSIGVKGGVSAVLQVGLRWTKDLEGLILVANTLWNLAEDLENCTILANEGGIKLLSDSMKRFLAHPDLLTPACGTIMHIARHRHFCERIIKQNGIKMVLAVFHKYPSHDMVVPSVVGAQTVLAADLQSRSMLLRYGSHDVLNSMEYYVDNVHMQMLLVGLLLALTRDPIPEVDNLITPRQLVHHDAVESVCILINKHLGERDLMHYCMGFYANLAAQAEYVMAIGDKALRGVLDVSERYVDDVDINSKINHLYAELCAKEEVLRRIVSYGGVPNVVGSMSKFKNSSDFMCAACHFICAVAITADVRNSLIECEGVDMVLDSMKSFSDNPSLLCHGAGALWALAHEEKGKEKIVENGGLELLAVCLKDPSSSKELVRYANGALRSLSVNDKVEQYLAEVLGVQLEDETETNPFIITMPKPSSCRGFQI